MTTQQAAPTLDDPLAALKDIHPPLEPNFWPPSWEWYILLLVIVVVMIGLALAFRKKQGPRWYRSAKSLLKNDCQHLEQQLSSSAVLKLNQSLKRIAISLDSRQQVAHLQGTAWCQWLDKSGQSTHFSQGPGRLLQNAYDPALDITAQQASLLTNAVLDWLKTQADNEIAQKPKPWQAMLDKYTRHYQHYISQNSQFIKLKKSIRRFIQQHKDKKLDT